MNTIKQILNDVEKILTFRRNKGLHSNIIIRDGIKHAKIGMREVEKVSDNVSVEKINWNK